MASHDDDQTPRIGERIAKMLARAGIASRREVERMIDEGRVAIDGIAVTTPATLLTSLAGVAVDGRPVAAAEEARLFVYHKPTGLLVTERDPAGRPTIYDRLPNGLPRLVPVGRLDLNTEGLLLLTTDGGLKRTLELPASGVERTYRARVHGHVSQPDLEALIDGIEIEGIRYGAIDANLERRTGTNAWIELTLTEGKNREVRRVLEHLGLQVGRLIRTRYGPFILADMPVGTIGEVRSGDLAHFERQLAKKQKPDALVAVVPLELPPSGRAERTAARAAAPAYTRAPVRPEPVEGHAQQRTARSSVRPGPVEGHTQRRTARTSVRPEPVEGRSQQRTARTSVRPEPVEGHAQQRTARSSVRPEPVEGRSQQRTTRTSVRPEPVEGHAQRRTARSSVRPEPVEGHAQQRTTRTSVRPEPVEGHAQQRTARTPVRPEPVEGNAQQRTARGQRPSTNPRTARPATPGRPTTANPTDRAATRDDAPSPRPPRPQRKPGWARAKPKPGPGRPRK